MNRLKTIELTYPHTLSIEELPETVSAIGFFDGVHKGHQKVIQAAVAEAQQRNMESAVITFHPHPSVVLKKDVQDVKYITPISEKKELLMNLQVDRVYMITFNKELSRLSPQEFIDHFIIGLNIKGLVGGFDYTFGHKGKGNMSNIADYDRGKFSHMVIDQVTLNGEKVSSTAIRSLLKKGRMEEVNNLLGRPYRLSSTVIKGDQRGRELGYPTANLSVDAGAIIPDIGIYAVKVIYKNDRYNGMASVGTNPTFTDNKELSVEVNILDFNQNIYGEKLSIEWHKYMRDEVKYEGPEALIKQLEQDEQNIRAYFGKYKPG